MSTETLRLVEVYQGIKIFYNPDDEKPYQVQVCGRHRRASNLVSIKKIIRTKLNDNGIQVDKEVYAANAETSRAEINERQNLRDRRRKFWYSENAFQQDKSVKKRTTKP